MYHHQKQVLHLRMVHVSTHSAVCSGSVVRNVGPDAGQQRQCPHRDIWQLQQLQHINNTETGTHTRTRPRCLDTPE